MKVSVAQKDLVAALSRCQGVVYMKTTLPVLSNILLEAKGGRLRYAATDLYRAVSGSVEAEVSEGGSICVPARDTLERAKALPAGGILLTANPNGTVDLKAVASPRRFKVHGLPGDNYPAIPTPDPAAVGFNVSAKDLYSLLAHVAFSISTDSTRPHLNSALLESSDGKLRAVSTDGHRLTLHDVSFDGPAFSVLIPLAAVQNVKGMLDDIPGLKGDVTVTIDKALVHFDFPFGRFTAKSTDSVFPPYGQVVPAQTDHAAIVPRAQLIDTLQAVSISSSERTGGVMLVFTSGTLRVEATNPSKGDGADELPVDYTGADMKLGVNARYCIDAAKAVQCEQVSIGFSGELDPIKVTPADGDETGYVAVVMPMRTE